LEEDRLDLREAISKRQSIRIFKPGEVEKDKIQRVLEDANRAPSAGNLQARDFIVVELWSAQIKTEAGPNTVAEGRIFTQSLTPRLQPKTSCYPALKRG
jgi:nitroreductase